MANISNVLSDIFFGTEQSKYAAMAIFITIAILCFFILFTAGDITVEQRLVIVFFILLTAVPSILFSLFELTCIVTGGTPSTRWWCYWLAWFITIIIIVYCLFIIISMFLSMASYDTAMNTIVEEEQHNKISASEANAYAKDMMNHNDMKKQDTTSVPPKPPQMPMQPSEPPMSPQMAAPQMAAPQMAAPQMPVEPSISSEMSLHMPSRMQLEPTTQNSLDTMGYDSSDIYATISNFENAPKEMFKTSNNNNNNGIPTNNAPKISKFTNVEPFSLESKAKEFATNISSVFGI